MTHPPPPGGYGSGPQSKRFGPGWHEPEGVVGPRRSLKPFITVAIVVVSLSTLLVIAVLGLRRYIRVAKTAEAQNSLAEIAKDAVAAHAPAHRICPSATQPVPLEQKWISGKKYQSTHAEWRVDEEKNAGFACLGFERVAPQYYQYRYEATPSSFVARGYGDLNADGVFSEYTWSGHVVGDRLVIDPSVTSTEPFFSTGFGE